MKQKLYILIVIVAAMGCRQPYNPKPVTAAGSYLVVEGSINTGQDSTIIRLGRTVPLSSVAGTKPELGAVVTIVSNTSSYPVIESGNGYYKAPGLNLSNTGNYSLKITTTDGKVYQSDFVPVKNSPAIDSVYYRIENNGLQLYADTHDPANNTKYYRWDFNETFEFHSAFQSFDYLSTTPVDTVLPRPLSNQVYACWQNDASTDILLNSSARLAKDVIENNPIVFIPSTSEKIGSRYSILVKQYALTADAYNYFVQLKKNTEQLGSIFDAQPSELTGNIHCLTSPTEPVLGYITAGATAETRIFIDNRSLPAWLASSPYSGCRMDTDYFSRPVGATFVNDVQLNIYTGIDMPIYNIQPPASPIILGYAASSPFCVDCTLRGTNVQPSFWTNE